jgi:hypothetical protein
MLAAVKDSLSEDVACMREACRVREAFLDRCSLLVGGSVQPSLLLTGQMCSPLLGGEMCSLHTEA